MLAGSQHTQPTIVNEDAGCVVGDGTHRASRRYLGCVQGGVSGRTFSRKDFDRDRRIRDPLLHQGPCWLLAINEFGEGTHGFLRANDVAHLPPRSGGALGTACLVYRGESRETVYRAALPAAWVCPQSGECGYMRQAKPR